ncbi:TetR/AcrR family transcriptional regulator [Dickeya dadantii]|uniref:TetR/AcrR family transcriptional regulator n=1 Tax=Dickeya dadantii TaxID=204038 RepID=UPI001C0CBAF3|nr:TetR/AcrR family transcriptional regulator [Dickeya dadantii]MCA7014977.1 TetR/AcrR family transcriptional regulator [Dickeya dadantii]QWT40316.1 TetR/AcrR family transcriptional regulator [Dickeya dadantii]
MAERSVTESDNRGPAEHNVREQIVQAATEFFGLYGYEKTTVSDLAKSIGFSKAYIYKFFHSKQAIGEVICANRLRLIMDIVTKEMAEASSASDKLRRMFRSLVDAGSDLFFHDRKLYDIAAAASIEQWPSAKNHKVQLKLLLKNIIVEGRQAGEFERRSPLDEIVDSIFLVLLPYVSPVQLQYNLDDAQQASQQLPALILRSLMP